MLSNMINVEQALKNDRFMKAATGFSPSEFNHMSESFDLELHNEKWTAYEKGVEQEERIRKPGGGRPGNLKTAVEKLFFILFYFKCYPTFDILGFLFGLNRSNAFRNVQKLTATLERVLDKKMVLPKRKINTFEELIEMFPGVKDLFIDGTERPIQRPKDNEKQKKIIQARRKHIPRKT
jgi:hypothetical protein